MIRFVSFLLFCLCLHSQSVLAHSVLSAIRLSSPGQIELDIKGELPAYKLFSLHHPERIVLDLSHTQSSVKENLSPDHTPQIRKIRIGQQADNRLRLVFEVDRAYQTRLEKKQGAAQVHQLLVTLQAKAASKEKALPLQNDANKAKHLSPQGLVPNRLRDVIVVLDPGHGGKDPGAIGPARHCEKNLVLAIAQKLKQIIDKQPGMQAVLTRKGDYYIGLRERLQIARKADADIFVAIHADAFINQQSNGASVFALSPTGATSEAARWLAEKENYSELGGVNLAELNDDNGMVRSVLIDLSQTATISASLNIGQKLLQSLGKMTRLHNEKVEQARFVVLKSPDIPSVLVETGFISNPKEERNLSNPHYQSRMAQAMFQGIKAYFWEFPPYGSRVELLSAAKTHVVQRGQTLSGIASQYHCSQKLLMAANQLTTSHLHVGQQLVIPPAWA
ncbi:MAG: N-acetylmuramoyl-L-alanine amidase [Legionellaceae bacterium]|nr:N-acetylmuramoyl-L-alanine amidase [Legionellaceae bacterium]